MYINEFNPNITCGKQHREVWVAVLLSDLLSSLKAWLSLVSGIFWVFFSCMKPSLSAGGLIFDWAAAARAEQTQWARWKGKRLEMRCAASSRWIWRTWLLCNKKTLWDIFYLLVGRRELCSWDIFLRTAMHNHHIWIVSKCCSGAALNQGGCHCECTSWSTAAARSIPGQAELWGELWSSGRKEENFLSCPSLWFLGVSPTIAPKSLPRELRGSKSHPSCASVPRAWTRTGMSWDFRMEQFPMDEQIQSAINAAGSCFRTWASVIAPSPQNPGQFSKFLLKSCFLMSQEVTNQQVKSSQITL